MTPLASLKTLFTTALASLADSAKLPDYVAMIKPAGNPEHGDYQANMAMATTSPAFAQFLCRNAQSSLSRPLAVT